MVRYCGQCGTELKSDASFCSKCGAKSDLLPEKSVKNESNDKKINETVNNNTELVKDNVR